MAENITRETVNRLLASFSGQQSVLTIPRAYITLCEGDINAALLLSQCVYWSDRTKQDGGWFAKSYLEWYEELGFTQYQVSRAAKLLETFGLERKLKRFNGSPTLHYRISMDAFSKSVIKKLDNPGLSKNLIMDDQKTSQSLTETTTETTTEKEKDKSISPVLDVPEDDGTKISPELQAQAKSMFEALVAKVDGNAKSRPTTDAELAAQIVIAQQRYEERRRTS